MGFFKQIYCLLNRFTAVFYTALFRGGLQLYVDKENSEFSKITFQLFRFAIVGFTATTIHYCMYLWLLHLFSESIAYSLGYVVSFVCNFILTCIFTFHKKANMRRGIDFCLVHIVNYGIQVIFLKILLWMDICNVLAPIPVYCISVPVNFILVRYVFQKLD